MKELQVPEIGEKFLEEVARKHDSSIRIISKKDSWLMKIIAVIVYPFNSRFNEYITTIGSSIYMTQESLDKMGTRALLELLSHETQHVIDFKKNKYIFALSYLFPQTLALLSLLAVFAVFNPWWWLSLLALLFLTPLPAYWRYKAEIRGYRTSIFMARKMLGYNDEQMQHIYLWIISQLCESPYYFAWPFPKAVLRELQNEEFMTEPYYQEITAFLVRHGQV